LNAPTTPPCLLNVDNISVTFDTSAGAHPVLQDFSFHLSHGSIACLLGSSGCGKTTALRAIAGFQPIQSGRIVLNEQEVSSARKTLVPEQRRIGMVFQDYALFPHLSIADNIAFGLRHLKSAQRQQRVQHMLTLAGLKSQEQKYPHELSGGQQQRVALARALAPQPALLLMDEPFSNLDVDLRERLSMEVRNIIKESETTAILVTHDQNEAFAMADEIGVINQGRIEQWDNAYALYHEPKTRWVADFIGQGVFLPGVLIHQGPPEPCRVEIELGRLALRTAPCLPDTAPGAVEIDEVDVLLRPDDIQHDDASPLQAEVVRKAFRGAEFLYTLKLPSGRQIQTLVPSHHNHAIGEMIGIRLDADHVVTFARESA